MPKQTASTETQQALCDFLKACDVIDFANVAHLLATRASPMTIEAVKRIEVAYVKFDDACGAQYGRDDNLSGAEFYIMHNDPRDPGPDDN